MMLEYLVAYLLQRYLGNYVRGLNKEALKISVWKGDVELKNVQLKPEALNALKLPVKVKAGFLGSVKLKVPWSRLGQDPVLVYLDHIFLLAEPATQVEGCSEDAVQEAKKIIEEMELKLREKSQQLKSEMNKSWLGSLISTIIGNLKLSISNIHIRYEDGVSNPGRPFAAGVRFDKLSAVTVDDIGKETFITGGALDLIQKSVELDGLTVYLDSDIIPWHVSKEWEDLLPSEWFQIFKFGTKDGKPADRLLQKRTTIGNGPPESIFDSTREIDSDLSNQNFNNQAFSRKHWRLVQHQNGLRIFEELLEVDHLPRSCSRAMKAVGVVEASCEEIFELVMSMDGTRFEWDCSFQHGSLVEEVDGHTAILYHRLRLDWFPMFVWPRDLCYVRYWRRNDDGSYVVLFRTREHENCSPQPGCVRVRLNLAA